MLTSRVEAYLVLDWYILRIYCVMEAKCRYKGSETGLASGANDNDRTGMEQVPLLTIQVQIVEVVGS